MLLNIAVNLPFLAKLKACLGYCCVIVCCFVATSAFSQTLVVKIAPESPQDVTYSYFKSLLTMALNKTQKNDADYELVAANEHLIQEKAVSHVRRGVNLDVLWTMTSLDRESQLQAIYIPLVKGLLGHRVLAITPSNLSKFAAIKNINELKVLVAGQGIDWPDTDILSVNDFDVIGTNDYRKLYPLLAKGRVDYYPRSIIEAWREVAQFTDNRFVIEPNILLRYRSPIYFFVNKQNQVLASRLEKGLNMAIDDGSFDKGFNAFFEIKKVLQQVQINKRKIFDLDNPKLSANTPVQHPKYWLELRAKN